MSPLKIATLLRIPQIPLTLSYIFYDYLSSDIQCNLFLYHAYCLLPGSLR